MKDNILRKTTSFIRMFWDLYGDKEAVAVDATCGNGNDSLYLCNNFRKVYCFDIQQQAIENTTELLKSNGLSNFETVHDSHEKLDEYVREKVKLVVYNLGYLPKGDKNITTQAASSVNSIKKALDLLAEDGLISITVYWGHPQGKIEREQILEFAGSLDSSVYQVNYIKSLNQDNCPPEIILISHKR